MIANETLAIDEENVSMVSILSHVNVKQDLLENDAKQVSLCVFSIF